MAVGRVTAGGPEILAISDAAGEIAGGRLLGAERMLPRVTRWTGDLPLRLPSSRLMLRHPWVKNADVVHLHNLHGNFFDLRSLGRYAVGRNLVWTLHDMWALTGHCAYSYECDRWRRGCGDCPLFEPEHRPLDEIPQAPWGDDSARWWRLKQSVYEQSPISVAAPSRWLRDLAADSMLGAHPSTSFHHVPYGLDLELYRPIDRSEARTALGIEPGRPVILFAAAFLSHLRKGISTLVAATRTERVAAHEATVLTFGSTEGLEGQVPRLHSLGRLSDDRMQALAYSAADLVVVPSLADNQPLVALEAMACGTPVVASAAGGLPELVGDRERGLAVPPGEPEPLSRAIAELLGDDASRERMARAARSHLVAEHGLERSAASYREIYQSNSVPRSAPASAGESASSWPAGRPN